MWTAFLNLEISIHNSSSSSSPMAGTRLRAPNLPDISLGRNSSSERAPASSNSFIIGFKAWTKASAFFFGTRYRKTEQYAILLLPSVDLRLLFSLNQPGLASHHQDPYCSRSLHIPNSPTVSSVSTGLYHL